MRFSSNDDLAFPDPNRPLNVYLPLTRTHEHADVVCCCPADRGITDSTEGLGTGSRTAFRSFGTSYRANSALLRGQGSPTRTTGGALPSLDIAHPQAVRAPQQVGIGETSGQSHGGVVRSAILTAPSRMLVMGDPVWYERAEETGRSADWHGVAGAGNMLFMDGSVRFQPVRPRTVAGPIVFDPQFEFSTAPVEALQEAAPQRAVEAGEPSSQ
jgi:prepilin-type processing-associated H-X9-DG protein